MRNEFTSLTGEEEALTADLESFAQEVELWETDCTSQDLRSNKSSNESHHCGNSRVKERQEKLFDYHAKIGALDRKVRK